MGDNENMVAEEVVVEKKSRRIRRTKGDVLVEKIATIDKKIASYEEKISDLKKQKVQLQNELNEFKTEKSKAKEEAEAKKVMSLIKKNGISLEDLQALIQSKN